MKTQPAILAALLGGCLSAVAAEPGPEVKVTGIVHFRGMSQALCEVTLPGRPVRLRPILGPGERSEGLEILSIDEKKGTVTLQFNKQSQTLSVTEAEAQDGPPGRTFNLKSADAGQLLEIYQSLAERTLFRSPILPRATIELRSTGVLPTEAALNELAQAFATKSITLVPSGGKFAFAVPTSQLARLQSIKPPDGPSPPSNEVFPVGLIKFMEADLTQVLDIYQELSGRTVLLAANTPRFKISLRSQTEWTRPEAIWALETAIGLGDLTVFRHQTNLAIVQPSTLAGPPKEFVSNQSAATTSVKEIPAGGIKFWEASSEQFLQLYASLSGREPLPIESSVPPSRVSIRTQTPLTSAEAIYALDALATVNGLQFVLVGDKQVKLAAASVIPPIPRPKSE